MDVEEFRTIPLPGFDEAFEDANETEESPVIILPDERKEQLQAKLDEYHSRMAKDGDPYTHPEQLLFMGSGAAYKSVVLERVLRDGSLRIWDLSLELSERLGPAFNPEKFTKACAVIKDYCETGGINVQGGTGLPQINPL